MVIFEKIRYKNLLSSGNAFTEIVLDEAKSTLIVGENGAGKSTIIEAITFGLYGKPFRKINKPQLISSINKKDLLVEVEFSIGKKKYLVRRGMKPNVFEIWKDGELINQEAATKDYQGYLEKNILKISYKSFGQIVILGKTTFVPFMQLPSQHRREVIEDLLDIGVFSTMNTLLRDKIADNKTAVMDTKYRIDLLNERIKSSKEHNKSVREMKVGAVEKIQRKLENTQAEWKENDQNMDAYQSQIDALLSSISNKSAVEKKHRAMLDIRAELTSKIRLHNKEVDFYEKHDNCPTCKQHIEESFKKSSIGTKLEKVSSITDALKSLEDKLAESQGKLQSITEVEKKIDEIKTNLLDCKAKDRIYMTTVYSLEKELREAKKELVEVDTTKINDLVEELRELENKQKENLHARDMYAIAASMLKDGGIKSRIIKQYIPVMNKIINRYLSALDFFVDFQLDENFNETIKSRFRDEFSYSSFSEGEKAKIDTALILTWRAISRMRNSVATNLLVMDEVFDGSLDAFAIEALQKILQETAEENRLNIFVISHKERAVEGFDSVIRVKKMKNFSEVQREST